MPPGFDAGEGQYDYGQDGWGAALQYDGAEDWQGEGPAGDEEGEWWGPPWSSSEQAYPSMYHDASAASRPGGYEGAAAKPAQGTMAPWGAAGAASAPAVPSAGPPAASAERASGACAPVGGFTMGGSSSGFGTRPRYEWAVPQTWGELKTLARDASVTSPAFELEGCPLQLEFYPNGTKVADSGCSTLQLIRGEQSKGGIKFTLSLNGRSNGPKACLGRRYVGDYPRPADDSEESDSKRIVVCLVLLGVF
eukprot:TRINITY_DN12577_c0_g1_i1.p1 TRINITY_DN12577_c0_g1~~TRINITY_DN12577_c0_g1_i1.p1  ORF type:complete len:250 (-),score=53.88 TRINITY_DN12577_c0_g1_i1:318-1067(-)